MYEIGDDIFTSSELQCTNVLIDFFLKEMLRRSFFDGEFPEFFINFTTDLQLFGGCDTIISI